MKNNLVGGYIPKGESCFASDICFHKYVVCNGDGCPVCDGKVHTINFSCGAARFFALFGDKENEE